jgi:RNA polymerase sigma-70 factor (ECF subfamily)
MAFAAGRCENAHDVADCVSETFVSAINGASTFRADRTRHGSARGWLFRIAANVAYDEQRRSAREHHASRIAARRLLDQDDIERIDAMITAAGSNAELERAVVQLRPSERDVVRLVVLDGLTTEEAAIVLDVSQRAVRTRLSRAKARLRTEVGPSWPGLGSTSVAQT